MPDWERPPSGDDVPSGATTLKPRDRSDSDRVKVGFTPGTMLAGRYRIVALLGRGGMGEVYRAEDTKLGQSVALKFLPSGVAKDGERLQRLCDEVRLGRQVSHPNVCRMYDISEWEGHHFISMEYIDGEDLASLLRRIGQLPEGKAIELARDLCAGLAAAHSLGIVHRDLKPANVMIDGRGDAKITDFGLAALAEDLERRREVAGTPAYMAPEQLEGAEVTHKTDLYALGLIFYEMFTGKRLFEGRTPGEILSQQKILGSPSLSRDTGGLDPAIQRVILRCLEQSPAKRPASIHSVLASLPGGDPLQAAIDAGETPSPEMVAAAGSTGELAPRFAWPMLILTILVFLATAAISPRVRLYGQTDLPLPPIELVIKAREILAGAGLKGKPADDVAFEMGVDSDYRLWKREQNRIGAARSDAVERTFSPLIFGYRESPVSMKIDGVDRVNAFGSVPALAVAGMSQVALEPDGRLRRLVIVPPEQQPANAVRPDWGALFAAAGLAASDARETIPGWRPPVGSDARFAWLVPVRGLANPVRVEAASFSGNRVWFEVITPWKRPFEPLAAQRSASQQLANGLLMSLILAATLIGLILGHRNVRRGRGDRHGALRMAAVVVVASLIAGTLRHDHYWDPQQEAGVIFGILGFATFFGVLMWIWYLALEPYLRRRWPRTLIAWSRLLQGRWLDPLVGQSVLIGALAGGAASLVRWVSLAAPSWLGWTPPVPWDLSFLEITRWRYTFGYLGGNVRDGMGISIAWMVVLLIVHLVFRRRAVAIGIVLVLLAITQSAENYAALEWSAKIFVAAAVTWVMVRHGLLALAALNFTMSMFDNFPMTLDPSVWYFNRALVGLAVLISLAIFGFVRALGSHALFAEPVLEE